MQELAREGRHVQQKNLGNLYAGSVIRDRFQVMEEVIGGRFYVVDLMADDLIIRERRDGPSKTFATIADAEAFIQVFTPAEQHATKPTMRSRLNITPNGRAQQLQQSNDIGDEMAKTRQNGARRKAPAAAKRVAPRKAPVTDRAPRETAAAMFQQLIRDGRFTDDTIFRKVQDKFGLDDNKRTYVQWYRNYLRKRGEKVPDARG